MAFCIRRRHPLPVAADRATQAPQHGHMLPVCFALAETYRRRSGLLRRRAAVIEPTREETVLERFRVARRLRKRGRRRTARGEGRGTPDTCPKSGRGNRPVRS